MNEPYADFTARMHREQGAAREIAREYVCQHRDKSGLHEGEHEIVSDLIWGGAPRAVQEAVEARIRQVEEDAIACFIQSQWSKGWTPVREVTP